MEANILTASPVNSRLLSISGATLLHILVIGAALLAWKTAIPPVVGANIMTVELIMKSPSPGGAEGKQKQVMEQKEETATPKPVHEPKQKLAQTAPLSTTGILPPKPKSVKKPIKVQKEKETTAKPRKTKTINGQTTGQTTQQSTQQAGIKKKDGQAGKVQAAQYQLGSASNPKPKYPKLARKRGWQGRVILNVYINEQGHPVHVLIAKSSGHKMLDRAALKTVKKWIFQPARKAGIRTASQLNIPIRFDLRDA